jgi:hypothetical protein
MRFLHQLLSRCASWIRRKSRNPLDSANPEQVPVPRVLTPDELVTRFIYSEKNIRKSTKRPKRGAFDPSPYMELSVVHSSGLSDNDVWRLGKQTVGNAPGRSKIHARADIPVQSLTDVKLRALRDDKPFRRHTSVIDWPIGVDGNDTKALWLQICLELSEDHRIRLELLPTPVVQP